MRHTKWKTWGRAVALIAILAMLPAAPAISALQPATAPDVEAALEFEIGSVIGRQPNPDGEFAFTNDMVLETEMSGFDGGAWEIVRWPRGGPPSTYASGDVYRDEAVIAATVPGLTITDDDGSYGGGSQQNRLFDVVATNPGTPAAETSVAMGAKMYVVQQDGQVLGGYSPDSYAVTTKGKWLERNCKCWLGGTDIRTFQKWARVEFTVTADEGQVIAVIMPMAPNRGEAKIKLDGVNQGRIDTYSPVKRNRVVMWQTPPLSAGVHTLSVINLATPGHARIDVDAFVMTEGIVPSPAP
jgi:hypothetical protein